MFFRNSSGCESHPTRTHPKGRCPSVREHERRKPLSSVKHVVHSAQITDANYRRRHFGSRWREAPEIGEVWSTMGGAPPRKPAPRAKKVSPCSYMGIRKWVRAAARRHYNQI
ncbi:rCG63229 [Rattus norvegicus]|uniref:RCG63229 n=1 Tax=Rattus norvegicus TaxID=10116 RepID=A6IY87_RAT|nr:rCG63229 [Rattus norvegicus]